MNDRQYAWHAELCCANKKDFSDIPSSSPTRLHERRLSRLKLFGPQNLLRLITKFRKNREESRTEITEA